MIAEKKFFSAKRLTGLAILSAFVVILQFWGSGIKIGSTPLNFVLVPIVLAGVIYGEWAGAILGCVSGFVVLISGMTGVDAFTLFLLTEHPIITTLLCLGKGGAAGFFAGLLFKIISKKSPYAAVFTASIAAPIINTGLFILGSLTMSNALSASGFIPDGQSVMYFLVVGCAGINFIVELIINIICAPAVYTVVRVISKKLIKGNQ